MKKGNFYTDLPPWGKFVVIMAGTAIVVYSAHFIYQKIKDAHDEKSQRKENDAAKKELKNLADKGIVPTFSEAAATMMANQLFTAMDGFGTYEDQIYNVLKQMKNDADFYIVSTAFGILDVTSLVIGSGHYGGGKKTLSQALIDELSTSEQAEANKILSANKLTIRV